jgi:hypothetical protein
MLGNLPDLLPGVAFIAILIWIGTRHTLIAFRQGFSLSGLFTVITLAAISFAILFGILKLMFRGHL